MSLAKPPRSYWLVVSLGAALHGLALYDFGRMAAVVGAELSVWQFGALLVAVLGAAVGTLLLALRSRYAVLAYGIGLVVDFPYIAFNYMGAGAAFQGFPSTGGFNVGLMLLLMLLNLAFALFFPAYAYRMKRRGVLR